MESNYNSRVVKCRSNEAAASIIERFRSHTIFLTWLSTWGTSSSRYTSERFRGFVTTHRGVYEASLNCNLHRRSSIEIYACFRGAQLHFKSTHASAEHIYNIF